MIILLNFVTSFENTGRDNLVNEEAIPFSSYPRKRVSRLIQRGTNLDSRVRGNDESRGQSCGEEFLHFHSL